MWSQVGFRKHPLWTKLVEVLEFQLSYFKSWKIMLLKHFTQCQQIWKTQQWPQDWKRSVFISIPKKGNAKECSSYHTIALISHAGKVMLKILQARLQHSQWRRIFVGFSCFFLWSNGCWLVPLAFLNSAWPSGSSRLAYCWSLICRIWAFSC